MTFRNHISLILIILLFTATTCLGNIEFVDEFKNGNIEKARLLFWEKIEDINKNPPPLLGKVEAHKWTLIYKTLYYGILMEETRELVNLTIFIDIFSEALEKEKEDVVRSTLFLQRGRLLRRVGDYNKSLKDLYEVEKIFRSNWNDSYLSNPTDGFQMEYLFLCNSSDAYLTIALILAACHDSQYRDGRRAVDYANNGLKLIENYKKYFGKETNIRLKKEESGKLAILAASYAEDRNYQEAIKIQKQSIDKSRLIFDETIIKSQQSQKEKIKKTYEKYLVDSEQILRLYMDGKPYRSPIPVKPIN